MPFFRFITPEGEWRVENEGVAPDIEVTLDPAAVNRGEDPQLDAAIATVLAQLKDTSPCSSSARRPTRPRSASEGLRSRAAQSLPARAPP